MEKSDLSPAEFEIMDILWKRGSATIKDIQQELSSKRELARTTISTLLTRMHEKGYVESRQKAFAYEFYPLVEKDGVVNRKLRNLVETILGGDVAPLASYIVKNRKLTPEQITMLEEIVRSENEGKDNG